MRLGRCLIFERLQAAHHHQRQSPRVVDARAVPNENTGRIIEQHGVVAAHGCQEAAVEKAGRTSMGVKPMNRSNCSPNSSLESSNASGAENRPIRCPARVTRRTGAWPAVEPITREGRLALHRRVW